MNVLIIKDIKNKFVKKFIKSPPLISGNENIIQQKFKFVYTFLKKCDKIFLKEWEIMEIKKEMTIGELLEKAPEKADILLEAGMHCLGCPASQAETIEEACEVHGIDVEEIIKELNK